MIRKCLALAFPVVAVILRNQQVQLFDLVLGARIQIERNSEVARFVVDSRSLIVAVGAAGCSSGGKTQSDPAHHALSRRAEAIKLRPESIMRIFPRFALTDLPPSA